VAGTMSAPDPDEPTDLGDLAEPSDGEWAIARELPVRLVPAGSR
jgi:hypothetical protein